ncbi:unnamed protein product [Camellia sinensis]
MISLTPFSHTLLVLKRAFQWKNELCKSVQLIGIVVTPVQIKPLSSSKVVTWSRLAVKKSSTDTACKVEDGLTSASSTNLNK